MNLTQKKLKILDDNIRIHGMITETLNDSIEFLKDQHKKYTLLSEIKQTHTMTDNILLRKKYNDYYTLKIETELNSIYDKLSKKNETLMKILEKQVKK